jgi:hypothetical protein
MPRRRVHVGEDGEVDAVDLDLSPQQGPDDFVVTAGECEIEFLGHADSNLSVMAGHSRPKDGVLLHAYVPAIHVLLNPRKTWMPGIKPGMTMG